eukprot:4036253-Prymnesium_polylepis.1
MQHFRPRAFVRPARGRESCVSTDLRKAPPSIALASSAIDERGPHDHAHAHAHGRDGGGRADQEQEDAGQVEQRA